MLRTAYLTKDEQKLFAKLSATLREGWEVQKEICTYTDASKRQALRFKLYRAYDPRLRVLMQSFEAAESDREMTKILTNSTLEDVSDTALAELFFTMGPGPVSAFVVAMLKEAKTDQDVEHIAALSVIRHALLQSFSSFSVHPS